MNKTILENFSFLTLGGLEERTILHAVSHQPLSIVLQENSKLSLVKLQSLDRVSVFSFKIFLKFDSDTLNKLESLEFHSL